MLPRAPSIKYNNSKYVHINNQLSIKPVRSNGEEKSNLISLGIKPLHPAISLVNIFSEVPQVLRNRGKQFKTWLEILNGLQPVGFEVLTAVVMKTSMFWDITTCSPLKANRSGGRNMSPPPSESKNKSSNKQE
jgi:hypothetical protein